MKKTILLSGLIILFFSNILFATEVSPIIAKKVAENYYNYWSGFRTTGKIIETIEVKSNNTLVYYIFNFSTGGYMIISADDNIKPVLSYAFKGTFIENDPNLPPAYKYLLNSYSTQIETVIKEELQADINIKDEWRNYANNVFTNSKDIQDVSPLLDIDGIAWDQGCYYNAQCPTDASGSCGHAVTGCVATAMAQIMRFHKYPEHGTGSHTYTDSNYGTQTANFGNATYVWNSMPGSVTSSNTEVAEIMYHCGVSVDMSYSTSGSGAYVYGYVKESFVNFFSYDSEAMYAYRENYTETAWKDRMYTDLNNNLPIFYSGTDEEGASGHAFVCDGLQNTDEFHFNWGWSGYYNSYNTIDELIPGGTGTGGGNGDFSYNHQAVFKIHPNYGLTAVFSGTPTLIYEGSSVNFTDASYGDPTSWNWNFGDGGSSTTPNPVHYYNTSGTYDVSLTVGDGSDTDTQTKTEYIKVVPADAGFSLDFENCTDYSNDFFPWSTIDGDLLNTYGSNDCEFPGESDLMSYIAFNPSDAGFTLASPHGGQRVGMAICPSNGSTSDDWLISEHIQLGTNSSISLWALSPKPGTWGNDTYEVLVSTSGNSTSDFTVISGGSPIEAPSTWTQHSYDLSSYDGQSIYIAIHHPTTGMFMLWIDDIEINTTSGTTAINADFYASSTNVSVGNSVNFTDNSVGTYNSWEWNFGDGSSTSSEENPTHIYNTTGTYTVSLTISDGTNSDTETKTDYITINAEDYGEWIQQASGFSTASRGIFNISIADENTVWATAYDGTGSVTNIQEFTKTSNGGDTWTAGTINLGDTDLGIGMIHAYSSTTAWVAAYPNGTGQTGGIWKTTNGGTTWTRQNSASYDNASSFTNVVYFWDANNGFCQGDPINNEFELYTTTNGGTTWTAVPGANIPDPLSGEYGYTNSYDNAGNNIYFATNKGRIYHSSDKGYHFEVFDTPLSDFQDGSFSFKDASNGIIVNNEGNVYRTSNGGQNWSQLSTNGIVFTHSVCWIPGSNTIFTTGAAQDASGSSYSTDAGENWTTIDSEQHLCIRFIDAQTGWSGWFNTDASNGGMWKWNPTNTNFDNTFNENIPLSIYPNPANDLINIVFQENQNISNLKIFNVSGQLIYENPNNNLSNNKLIINTSSFVHGIYIVQISTDKNTYYSKFIIE